MSTVSTAPRSGRYLSFGEREEIAILYAQDAGIREIARRLGRSPSTISRELGRNAATRSGSFTYRATAAQWHADHRARRPKLAKLATNEALRHYVQERLAGRLETPTGTDVPGPENPMEWSQAWAPSGQEVGNRMEPGADLEPASGRFPR